MTLNLRMKSTKKVVIQFRASESVKADLEIVAELRGLSISSLLHSLVVRTIREEKQIDPNAFKKPPKSR